MRVYSYSEARQQFAELLNRASREGEVEIRRRDGQVFLVRPATRRGSPLDVPGIDAGLSRAEIVDLVRESRRSTAWLLNKIRMPQKPSNPRRRSNQRGRSVCEPA
jgi:antitoxin (DNA-binding transcriptional repressor) of toxin-antitoxin stability system